MGELLTLAHDWYARPLPAGVSIGEGSWLYSSFAFTHCRSERPAAVKMGRHCGIYNGCFFDLGPGGEVAIGDYSTLVGVIINSNSRVNIGSYCLLAHEVVIADDFASTPRCAIDGSRRKSCDKSPNASVTLGDVVWVGANAVLLKGAHIGNGAIIAARAVVDFRVPRNAVVAGNPARIVGYVK